MDLFDEVCVKIDRTGNSGGVKGGMYRTSLSVHS